MYSLLHGNSKTNTRAYTRVPSNVTERYCQQLKTHTADAAREIIIDEDGGWSAAPAEVMLSKSTVNNIARHVENRKLTSRGRPKKIDFDKIEIFKKQKTWFK